MNKKISILFLIFFFFMIMPKDVKGALSSDGYSYSQEGTSTSHSSVVSDNFFNNEELMYMMVAKSTHYTIPGLKNTNVLGSNCDSMVPQGICASDYYVFISAYDSDHEYNSVIYVLDWSGNLLATMVYWNNSHVGGLAFDGKYLWVCNSDVLNNGEKSDTKGSVSAISLTEIEQIINVSKTNSAKSVKIKKYAKHFNTETKASYCTYYDGKLWVGVFDETKNSLVYSYKINYDTVVPNLTKYEYLIAPNKTQGIAFYENSSDGNLYIIFTRSYGREEKGTSVIEVYIPVNYENYSGIGKYINKGGCIKTTELPKMVEQVYIHGSYAFLIFESGAKKYRTSVRTHNKTDCYLLLFSYRIVE